MHAYKKKGKRGNEMMKKKTTRIDEELKSEREAQKTEKTRIERIILAPLQGTKPPIWHTATHTYIFVHINQKKRRKERKNERSILFRNPLLKCNQIDLLFYHVPTND